MHSYNVLSRSDFESGLLSFEFNLSNLDYSTVFGSFDVYDYSCGTKDDEIIYYGDFSVDSEASKFFNISVENLDADVIKSKDIGNTQIYWGRNNDWAYVIYRYNNICIFGKDISSHVKILSNTIDKLFRLDFDKTILTSVDYKEQFKVLGLNFEDLPYTLNLSMHGDVYTMSIGDNGVIAFNDIDGMLCRFNIDSLIYDGGDNLYVTYSDSGIKINDVNMIAEKLESYNTTVDNVNSYYYNYFINDLDSYILVRRNDTTGSTEICILEDVGLDNYLFIAISGVSIVDNTKDLLEKFMYEVN